VSAPRIEWALEDAVGRPGCPVCALLRAEEARWWEAFTYEHFQEPEVWWALHGPAGLCRRHTAQLEARRDVVPGATVALAAVRASAERLAAPPARGRLRRAAPEPAPGAGCTACRGLEGLQELALRELDRGLAAGGPLAARFGEAGVVCVDHVVLARGLGLARAEELAAPTRRALAVAQEELERLLRSFEHGREAPDARLAEAWLRALELVRGNPGAVRAG